MELSLPMDSLVVERPIQWQEELMTTRIEESYQEPLVIFMRKSLRTKRRTTKSRSLIWRSTIIKGMIYYMKTRNKSDVWKAFQKFRHLLMRMDWSWRTWQLKSLPLKRRCYRSYSLGIPIELCVRLL